MNFAILVLLIGVTYAQPPTVTQEPNQEIPYMVARAAGDNNTAKRIKLSPGFSVCPTEISASGITLECIAPGATGKVEMLLRGAKFRVENAAPYTMAGDYNGQANIWTPPSGPVSVGCKATNLGMVKVSGTFVCTGSPSSTTSSTKTSGKTSKLSTAPPTVQKSKLSTAPPTVQKGKPSTAPPTVQKSKLSTAPPTVQTTKLSTAQSTVPSGTAPDTVLVPKIGAWTRVLPNYPFLAQEGQGGMLDGNLVGLGGLTRSYKSATNKCYAMSLTGSGRRQFRKLADMPNLYTHMGQVLHKQFFYGVGAFHGIHPKNWASKVCWRYDIRKDKWDRMPDLPEARGAGGAALVAGRFLVFTGGNIRNPKNRYPTGPKADRADTWFLDLNNWKLGWRSQPPIPQKRNHFSGITTCGRTFFVGGQKGDNYKGGNTVNLEEFVPCGKGAGKWIKRANLPYTLGHTSLGVLPYKCGIIVIGGVSNSKTDGWGDHQRKILWYNPAVDRWNVIGSYKTTVTAPTCGIYNGNKLICTAGETRGKHIEEVFETIIKDSFKKCDDDCKKDYKNAEVEPALDPKKVARCFN